MARIRTVKPEFWEDEVVGTLSRDARLLFIATWNLADDEGLLRWAPSYIKSSVFMYDDDIGTDRAGELMVELEKAGVVFPYRGGKAQQQLAVIPNFRKHQKINRPQPSRLPAPSLKNLAVREMYMRRDGWMCHLCKRPIPEQSTSWTSWNMSIDHLVPQSHGGYDYPSNLRAAHEGCNKGRGNRESESFTTPWAMVDTPPHVAALMEGETSPASNLANVPHESQSVTQEPETPTVGSSNSLNGSVNGSVSGSMTGSVAEGIRDQGKEGKGSSSTREARELLALIRDHTDATDDESHLLIEKIRTRYHPTNLGGYIRTTAANGTLADTHLAELRAERTKADEAAANRARLARLDEPEPPIGATPEEAARAKAAIREILAGQSRGDPTPAFGAALRRPA